MSLRACCPWSPVRSPRVARCGIPIGIALHWTDVAGALLVQARLLAGLTQTEAARRAGIAQSDVSAYETGRRQPTLPTLYKLLNAAGVEARIRLEPVDDHDASLAAWEATRPTEETQEWRRQQVACANRT